VAQLQQLGFRVAMDDIGMGHSGLSQLKALGADIIKIDKFFIDTITLDDNTKAIVQTLVQMAGRLGMDVLAEGVETEEQRQALLACGVDTGQGYLLAPALPLDRLKALLERAGGSPPLALVA
jgi:EAL domain-containing protein (putative c-di-GMP-specific phosphodiesterase class I)